MPTVTDPAALVAVDLPARIDRAFHPRLKALGLAVHDLSPLYLIQPRAETRVETDTGEIACRDGQVIVYDPARDRVTVMDLGVAGNRFAPIATATEAEQAASVELDPPTETDPPPSDPEPTDDSAIVPTGEGES